MTGILLRLGLRAIGHLPLPLGRGLGLLLGAGLWLARGRAWQTTMANLERCFPALSAAERRRLARASLLHTGRTFTDSARVWVGDPRTTDALVRETRGYDLVETARSRGDGILLILPHIGCWELVGTFFATRIPFTALYRPPRVAALEPLLRAGRERAGTRLAATDGRGVRTLYRALRAGEAIAILPDQAPAPRHGVVAPFFGQPAQTVTLVSRLARGPRVTAIACVMERLPRARGFRLHLLPAEPAIADADEVAAATAVNREVERCIALCPAQYMWSYRRFRRTATRRGRRAA